VPELRLLNPDITHPLAKKSSAKNAGTFPDLTDQQRRALGSLGKQRQANIGALSELGVDTTVARAIPWVEPATVQRG
jgi:hypothetical protein